MKNKLTDLNNHLFTSLERLNDEDLTDPEKIRSEVGRAKAVVEIGRTVVDNGRLMLDATQLSIDAKGTGVLLPKVLNGPSNEQG